MTEANSPVEDGKSAVAGKAGAKLSPGTKFGIGVLVAIISVSYIWLNAAYSHKNKDDKAAQPAYNGGGGQQFEAPVSVISKLSLPAPSSPPAAAAAAPLPEPTSPTRHLAQQQNPATAPIMAFENSDDSSTPPSSAAGPSAGSATGPQGLSRVASDADDSPLAQKLKPTSLEGEKASVMQNPDMTITEGTIIPCTLQTAIDSQLPGLVTCTVPMDIRGATGNVVLLDRGTKIVGELQNGLMQGQDRVFVDWTRAETPDHVIITLDSPGTDDLGRSGLPGAVDNHFLARFGGALMLTLVQGALQAGTIEAAGQGSSSSTSQQAGLGFVYSAQSNGQSIANTALTNTINIPPTLTKNQGDTVALIVAHDLDFSSVYQLHLNEAPTNNGG